MNKIIAFVVLIGIIYLCANLAIKRKNKLQPKLNYTALNVSNLNYVQLVYVPVHSKIFLEKGSRLRYLSTVLKIRNTSLSDSIYVSTIDYYDHQGKILKEYLDSAIIVRPMATAEIVVKEDEFKGKGDNFIVEWRAHDSIKPPIIQSISVDVTHKITFTNEGVVIDNKPEKAASGQAD